jgi:tRNA-guanine family transglycosylase
MRRHLDTRRGRINYPSFFPVTTFGGSYPLDEIVRPYLERFAPAIMVSHFYAKKMKDAATVPVFIDSGGFASLFEGAEVIDAGEMAVIKTKDKTTLHPGEILEFQQNKAEIGATLDFVIPPNINEKEAIRRQDLGIKNAVWAIKRRKSEKLRLFASIQAWDKASAERIMNKLMSYPFDGFALGGMVPRRGNPDLVLEIVSAIREAEALRPLHVFGIGQPRFVKELFNAGVDSVDSSSFVQYAADKRYLDPVSNGYIKISEIRDPAARCGCRVCANFPEDYFMLSGEINTLALTLHNLAAFNTLVGYSKTI